MSTEMGEVKRVSVTRFWAGGGLKLQITVPAPNPPDFFGYQDLTPDEVRELAALLNEAADSCESSVSDAPDPG